MTKEQFFLAVLKGKPFEGTVDCFPLLVEYGYLELARLPGYDSNPYLFTVLKSFTVRDKISINKSPYQKYITSNYTKHEWMDSDWTIVALRKYPHLNPNRHEICTHSTVNYPYKKYYL